MLGETYTGSNPVWFQKWAGLDGATTDDWYASKPPQQVPVYTAIYNNDPNEVDQNQSFYGGQDATVNMCFLGRQIGDGGYRDNHFPMSWIGMTPSETDESGGNALTRVMASTGGYPTANEWVMDIPEGLQYGVYDDCISWDCYWRPPSYPDGDDSWSVNFLKYVQGESEIGAWAPLALRAPSYNTFDSIYAMIKYDAFGTGDVAVFFANMEDDDEDVIFNPDWGLYSDQLKYFLTGGGDSDDMTVGKRGFQSCAQYNALPTWRWIGAPGTTNCYDDSFQLFNPAYPTDQILEMTLGACLLACLAKDDDGAVCNSVSVQWNQDDYQYGGGGTVTDCWGNAASGDDLWDMETVMCLIRSVRMDTGTLP